MIRSGQALGLYADKAYLLLALQVQVGGGLLLREQEVQTVQTLTEGGDLIGTVDRLLYDEMEYRAVQAEVCTGIGSVWLLLYKTQPQ